MDLLFAASAPWTWSAEKKFKELKEQRVAAGLDVSSHPQFGDIEEKAAHRTRHVENDEVAEKLEQ